MLTSFQLRAARSVLGLGVREVGEVINVSRTTISTWERQSVFHIISAKKKDVAPLDLFFNEKGIIFPDKNTLCLMTNLPKNLNHLTRFQLRASRAALGLTLNELASFVNIPMQVIAYLESKKNDTYINTAPKEFNEDLIRNFFEQQSIQFIDDFIGLCVLSNHNFVFFFTIF